jgi:hypothetical protein
MKTFKSKFAFLVDSKYSGFEWTGEYITADYTAIIENNSVRNVVITNTSGAPYVFGAVAIHGNWMELSREMDAAAKDHAIKELSGMDSNIHPTIMKAVPQQQNQTGDLIESLSNINEHFRGALASVIK